jgi:PhoPQ-activated pathogenicity-related protein
MRISTLQRSARRAMESRLLWLEPLEDRRLLSGSPWHNAAMPLDVNGSGNSKPTPTDALAVVSDLLVSGARPVPADAGTPLFYVDTNDDNLVTPRDALLVIRELLSPPTAALSTLVPFTIDRTPIVTVTTSSATALPNGTPVQIDVDLNNDGDFTDATEMGYAQASLFNGSARQTLPELPPTPESGSYSVRLRARFTDPNQVNVVSPVESLIVDTAMSSALYDYVHNADTSYHYSLANTVAHDGYTYYALDMTSQTWRSTDDVNKPVWRHWVDVVVPAGQLQTTALLFITGGNNNFGAPPSDADAALVSVAKATGSVVVVLHTVPNEPVIFTDETGNRSEDEIIAYTFNQYMEHLGEPGNETWPLLIAMAKAAVRAMDTAQDFVPTVTDTEINDFVVTGYSKRGWTTWLTAAVDDRVRGIIPGVFDNPNQGPQMVHHYEVYGFFSEAVQDYNNLQIFDRIMTPEGQQLSKIVDPYRYFNNGHFEIPKLMLNSAGDEFFVSDSSQYYFHDLPGEDNYLRYFPNTGHGLDPTAITSTIAFYYAILHNSHLPKFSWTIEPDGAIHAETVDTPTEVRMWQATNPTARDFRHAWHPEITWTSTVLDAQNGVYIADPPMPGNGATAYFIEFTFPSDLPDYPHTFTTEIWVKSTLPLYEWPFESGFPDPTVAVASAQAAVASALSIEQNAALVDEAFAVPLATVVAQNEASLSAAPAEVAATNAQTVDAVVSDFGDSDFGTDADLVEALFADAVFEHELEELAV